MSFNDVSDPCSSNPCQNGASCSIEITEYLCHCIAGYTGVHCETGKLNEVYYIHVLAW